MAKQRSKYTEGTTWRTVSNIDNPYGFEGAFPPDNSKLQQHVARDPMVAAFECAERVQRTEATFRDELYEGLQVAYAIGRHLTIDFDAFKIFYNLEFFRRGKRRFKAVKQQKNALRHVMNYVFNATTEAKRKRTGRYAAALDGYLRAGMPAHLVAEQIRADGGIEKLYEISLETAAARPKRVRAPAKGPDPDFYFGDEPMFHGGRASKTPMQDWSLDDLDDDPSLTDKDIEDSLFGVEVKHRPGSSGRERITLEVPSGMKARLLSLKPGQLAMVRVVGMKTEEAEDGEVRLRARRAFRWPA